MSCTATFCFGKLRGFATGDSCSVDSRMTELSSACVELSGSSSNCCAIATVVVKSVTSAGKPQYVSGLVVNLVIIESIRFWFFTTEQKRKKTSLVGAQATFRLPEKTKAS